MKKLLFVLGVFIYSYNYSQTVHYLGSELHPYLFDSTSNWIYENDSTHLIDTVFTLNIIHSYDVLPPGDAFEYYISNFRSTLSKNNFHYQYEGVAIFLNDSFDKPIYISDRIIKYIDTMKIGNNEFNNVAVMKVDSYVNYYWVKKVGIIRKDTLKNNKKSIWNLKSWNTKLIFNGISKSLNDKKITLYPNPCSDRIVLEFETKPEGVYIYNINGELICEVNILKSKIYEFNTSNLSSGLYIIKTIYKKGAFIGKFIKE
jgi:hypothetical protein